MDEDTVCDEVVGAIVLNAKDFIEGAIINHPDKNGKIIEQMNYDRESQATHSELDRLASLHPDYTTINRSPDFNDWIANKPLSIQGLRGSMSADDNIELLNLYNSERQPRAAN